ncbi:MAG: hypothetical protein ACOY4R_28165 [Pseudomonadota bacterium]
MGIAADGRTQAPVEERDALDGGEATTEHGTAPDDALFCRQLEVLCAWKRRQMPILDMPQGGDVLVWLLKGRARHRPLKDLYRGSRFSEPTMRWVLKALVDEGYIAIERHPDDLRVRTVQLTPKLMEAVQQYLDLLRACTQPLREPLPA